MLKDSKLDSNSRMQIDLIRSQLLLHLLLSLLQQLQLLHSVLRCLHLLLHSHKGTQKTSGTTLVVPLIETHRMHGVI
jgi:hypothetical protein